MDGLMIGGNSGFVTLHHGLQLFERELLVFAAFWFAIGLVDEIAIDIAWIWQRMKGRARDLVLPRGYGSRPLTGRCAVLIPAWQEADVIGATIAHALNAWPQRELRIYVGIYRNDDATLVAAMKGAAADPRVRLVIHALAGPTTKADCLNRLYAALCDDEMREGSRFRSIVLHDAEDMVHPAALQAIDVVLGRRDFVQIPVRPELQPRSRWIAGHYADEFTESHAKAMVVRSLMGAALPAAGVGCGFARDALDRLAERRRRSGEPGPFAAECLTEDYELGLLLSREGRGSEFVRLRDADGNLVATRSYFPDTLVQAVRQKTRWIHGIAFQAWDRHGWSIRPVELWMALRDRRGPLSALVLASAYLLLVLDTVLLAAQAAGWDRPLVTSPATRLLMGMAVAGFIWRATMRFAFTAREYGWREGVLGVLRIPVSNIIAIMAGRRALAAYVRALRGEAVTWDKTTHVAHPALRHEGSVPA